VTDSSAGREALIQNGDVKDARIHQQASELAMTREELRLVGARMQRIDPHRRPQYTMVERMAILELRAMRGWSKAETARRFFITDDTIRAWLRLVDTREPVSIWATQRSHSCAFWPSHRRFEDVFKS